MQADPMHARRDVPPPLILDGALGTTLMQRLDLVEVPPGDPLERLVHEQPDLVTNLHRDFLGAGAEALRAATFCALPHQWRAPATGKHVARALELARQAVREVHGETSEVPVMASVGPGLFGGPDLDEALVRADYGEASRELFEAGAAGLVLETQIDQRVMTWAVDEALAAGFGGSRPLWVFLSPGDDGDLPGTGTLVEALQHLSGTPVDLVGLNCGSGVERWHRALKTLRVTALGPVGLSPSRGVPEGSSGSLLFPTSRTDWVSALLDAHELQPLAVVGGCCGAGPGTISHLSRAFTASAP